MQQAPGTFAFLPPLRLLPDFQYLHRLLNLFTTAPQTRNRAPTSIRRSRGKTFRVVKASPASRASPRTTPCAVAPTADTDSSPSAPDQSPTSISTTSTLLSLYLQKKQDVSVSVGAVCMVRSVHSGMHTPRTNSTSDPRVSQILPLYQSPTKQPSVSTLLSSTATTWTSVTTTTTVGTHVFPACPACPACPAYPSHPSRQPFPTTASTPYVPRLSHPRCPALLPP